MVSKIRIFHSIGVSYGVRKKAFLPPDDISDKQMELITLLNDIAEKGKYLKLLYVFPLAVLAVFVVEGFSLFWFTICLALVHIYEFWIINLMVIII